MEQLLEIHSVPIILKCSVNREPVERTDLTADIEISKNDEGFALRCRSINVDMNAIKNSNASKNASSDLDNFSKESGKEDEEDYSASAMFTKGNEISVNYEKILKNTVSHKVSVPKREFDLQQLNVQYELDKMNFDLLKSENKIQFTPADVQFSIEQRPEVVIKYIGGPIYVPPSADPDYEPEVDVKA